jgi:tRNA nucleotidyltransferase (CCA-adding enzyme)
MWLLQHGKEAPWTDLARAIQQRGDALNRSDLAVTGSDLEALGFTGPSIGQTLARLLDRVLEEPSLNTREQLLKLVRDPR